MGNSEDLGGGYRHHGVATPISNHRGIVATVDGKGRNVALCWLFDHRGGYALLVIDAETGRSREIPVPFPYRVDCPYASVLSSRNLFYSHFNSHFCEFDPRTDAFTFVRKSFPQMAMGMTEDDNGLIWSVTYPDSGVVSFDPKTREFRDFGSVYAQNWKQYQRFVAADDAGWIYFSVGYTTSQIIAFDPSTGKGISMFAEAERRQGGSSLYRDMDGRVYGKPLEKSDDGWCRFHRGRREDLGRHEKRNPKPIITDSQSLFYSKFPDGKILKTCDLTERVIRVEDPKSGKVTENRFDYTSEGAHIMGLAAAPDGTICGGTAFPMRFFSYDPREDLWINRDGFCQWNTVTRQGDRFFIGAYCGGFLMEWDPAKPWAIATDKEKGKPGYNPLMLDVVKPSINRPHCLLAHPDGRTVVMGGTPDYGYTGGGLLIWDRKTKTRKLLEHTQIIPEHSTLSLVALPDRRLLGGTTTEAGTGGEKKAGEAELYVLDMESGRVEWHQAVFPGVQGYTDMRMGKAGLVFGFADRKKFFVFDPSARKVVHQAETGELGLTVSQQGPRVFVTAPDGTVYILFQKGIARLDQRTFRIETVTVAPLPIDYGGDWLDGRIWFASGSHVYSWQAG